MQILGRKRRIMLAILAAALLISLGLSFAAWDLNEVKALSASNTALTENMSRRPSSGWSSIRTKEAAS